MTRLDTNTLMIGSFKEMPRTGVVYVSAEAAALGYREGSPDWCNLGQGQPETGDLPGAPGRPATIACAPADLEYGPVGGLWELRESIATLYNRRYRRGLPSQYSAENVSISGGGRSALARAIASLGRVNIGHFLPDYTAYEELLDAFSGYTSIPIPLAADSGYALTVTDLRKEICTRGLSALLLSNPNNPTGRLIADADLADWVGVARSTRCALLLDEFYAHYLWSAGRASEPWQSAARHVDDVDRDPILLFDGLTKNWRLPGWRVTWTVGPKSIIEKVSSAGSFLDGGACRPMQRAAIELVAENTARSEAMAIGAAFAAKRALLLDRLHRLGVRVDTPPEGTFYVWGDLSGLPAPLNEGVGFFRAALQQRVIVVPGLFFDIDPGKRRSAFAGRFAHYARFSFGPTMSTVREACERLSIVINDSHPMREA